MYFHIQKYIWLYLRQDEIRYEFWFFYDFNDILFHQEQRYGFYQVVQDLSHALHDVAGVVAVNMCC